MSCQNCQIELRVVQRPVPDLRLQRVTLDQRVEIMVRVLRKELARQHQRAKNFRMKFDADPLELGFQKSVVEAGVVGNEKAAFQSRREADRDILEPRCRQPHLVGDLLRRERVLPPPGQRVDHGRPFADFGAVDRDDADLGDAIFAGVDPRRLDVDEGERRKVHWRQGRCNYRTIVR